MAFVSITGRRPDRAGTVMVSDMNLDHRLTAEQVAAIAARRGLRLDDAVALQLLADDVDQAERIAAMFERRSDAA